MHRIGFKAAARAAEPTSVGGMAQKAHVLMPGIKVPSGAVSGLLKRAELMGAVSSGR